jgi:hypothetical protein
LLDLHGNIPTFISITDGKVRIPGDGDQRSEVMAITIPK